MNEKKMKNEKKARQLKHGQKFAKIKCQAFHLNRLP